MVGSASEGEAAYTLEGNGEQKLDTVVSQNGGTQI